MIVEAIFALSMSAPVKPERFEIPKPTLNNYIEMLDGIYECRTFGETHPDTFMEIDSTRRHYGMVTIRPKSKTLVKHVFRIAGVHGKETEIGQRVMYTMMTEDKKYFLLMWDSSLPSTWGWMSGSNQFTKQCKEQEVK